MKASSRKVKQENMMDLFELGMLYDVEELRAKVLDIISNARVPNQSIIRQIPFMNKKKLMQTASNFFLKGEGLGVK
tara:strand:- start:2254 stop:2481 length:228 start_codon:yes stop_codon:yes gene_type:complete